MKITLSVMSFLMSSALAWQVPSDLEDGHYLVSFDADGTANMTKTGSVDNLAERTANAGRRVPRGTLGRREDFPWPYEAHCTGNDIPDQVGYMVAQQEFAERLDGGLTVPAHSIHFSIVGESILAMCNYADGNQPGSKHEIELFNQVLDYSCSAWRSGFIFQKSWNKTYWRTPKSAKSEICGNM